MKGPPAGSLVVWGWGRPATVEPGLIAVVGMLTGGAPYRKTLTISAVSWAGEPGVVEPHVLRVHSLRVPLPTSQRTTVIRTSSMIRRVGMRPSGGSRGRPPVVPHARAAPRADARRAALAGILSLCLRPAVI